MTTVPDFPGYTWGRESIVNERVDCVECGATLVKHMRHVDSQLFPGMDQVAREHVQANGHTVYVVTEYRTRWAPEQ